MNHGHMSIVSLGLAAGLLILWPSWDPTAEKREVAKLTASDADGGEQFGVSVSISGDVTVVGAHFDDGADDESGSAYVYRFNPATLLWVEETKLIAGDGVKGDRFGGSVSVSGDVAVVGAQFQDEQAANSGAAYVYRFDGIAWVEEAKLTAGHRASDDRFGGSVSVSGDVVVVGAQFQDEQAANAGAAYVYRFKETSTGVQEWVEEAQLTASKAAEGDEFGFSVSVSGDVAVVGARFQDGRGHNTGAAYVYRFTETTPGAWEWVEEARLTASDASATDNFGHSVSISNDVVVVGAMLDDVQDFNSGSAYVYRFTETTPGAWKWVEEAKLTASDASLDDQFGRSVSVSGDLAVVGAGSDNEGDLNAGAGYVYRFDPGASDWVEEAKLTASDAQAGAHFGIAVSVSRGLAVAGALDDGASSEGAVYVLEILESLAREMTDEIQALEVELFNGPNNKANMIRRNALADQATDAANFIATGDSQSAIDSLRSLFAKIDGATPPVDWMDDSVEKTALANKVDRLTALLLLE